MLFHIIINAQFITVLKVARKKVLHFLKQRQWQIRKQKEVIQENTGLISKLLVLKIHRIPSPSNESSNVK